MFVLPGTSILEAAARAGLVLDTPCGGLGTCGKCRVNITQKAEAPTSHDRKTFSAEELRAGWRLACRNDVATGMVVAIPASSLFGTEHQILSEATSTAEGEVCAAVRKDYVELTEPSLTDDAADVLRLEQRIGAFKIDLPLIRHLSACLRRDRFRGTAVLADGRLIDFESGDTGNSCYGVAFDLGTTTLVGELLDLCDGRSLGVVSRMNPQVSFGDDVLSRIRYAASGAGALEEMREAVARELAAMIEALCQVAGIRREHIYEASLAGNTTMEHILCGLDPTQLGSIPFVPQHARGLLVSAIELGLPIHHGARAYVLPLIGGFVGGDTVAGMLASGMDELKEPALLVDIGTNGEIVLFHDGKLYAASTAAGPAFEGARISCGMRGTHGAIEKVLFNDDAKLEVIGNTEPVGLCGSGLIDLVAELLRYGIVTSTGQLLPPEDLPPELPPPLAARVRRDGQGATRFVLVPENGACGVGEVSLTQRDVRELQLGCGAIRAGMRMLLREAGLDETDLGLVLVAGGFGYYIRRGSAQRIGLLPGGTALDRIRYVGNVSLAGARTVLLSTKMRRRGEAMARRTRHVELSTLEGFQEAFADAMTFPEND